jgi:methylamine dehydrogenase accessory protein MauD
MLEALIVSQIILWIAVVALAAVVFALVRQIGVLHERIAPIGALTIDKGPKVGDHSPLFELADLNRRPVTIGAENPAGRSTLLMFVSPTCPVCKKLLPAVKSLAVSESKWLDVTFTSDSEPEAQADFVARHHLQNYPLVLSSELGLTYRVSKLPYAVLIDHEGIVRAKGLVNTREHLESIVQAKQMGVASLQEYLGKRNATAEPPAVNGEGAGKHHG